MTEYQFYYAPEGRLVGIFHAASYKQAKTEFYKNYRQYKDRKGEIYAVVGGTI